MFDGDKALLETYKDIWPMLSNMGALMEKLRSRRFKRGSMDFDLAEAKLVLDKKGHTVDVALCERGISNQMIEEFMLLANETVANHARQMGIPFLYRSMRPRTRRSYSSSTPFYTPWATASRA